MVSFRVCVFRPVPYDVKSVYTPVLCHWVTLAKRLLLCAEHVPADVSPFFLL